MFLEIFKFFLSQTVFIIGWDMKFKKIDFFYFKRSNLYSNRHLSLNRPE
jgi:hypothetical protein